MLEPDRIEHGGAPAEPAPGPASSLDPFVAVLCAPISPADPCGPDLDAEGDADYLNFFAQVDGILPMSFFSLEDGKPFDPATIDIDGQLAVMKPLLARSHDIRLLTVRARLTILNRDLAGFSVTLAALAEWLDRFWDEVHPRPQGGSLEARLAAMSALDLPTVVFPLQYMPLLEARRTGPVTYRSWMIATGEVKSRAGDAAVSAAAIAEAVNEAEPAAVTAARRHIGLLTASCDRIRAAFAAHGSAAGLESLAALAGKIRAFIDPHAAAGANAVAADAEGDDDLRPASSAAAVGAAGPPPTSIAAATEALAAIAEYYSQSEPSSPALLLVRQAHQLVGKSFLEIMTILVPSQVEKAAFRIGTDQVFDLPVGKLSGLSEMAPAATSGANGGSPADAAQSAPAARSRYHVESRSQAVALLDSVQRYFRLSEPSSPVPMLCERARTLAERDFMGVLRDVLPKSALQNITADK